MAKILVIGGTAEGKKFIADRPEGHRVTLSVFSQMGADLVAETGIEKRVGPLDRVEMAALLRKGAYDYLVDLSHPYAAAVTANAKAAAEGEGVPYLRYRRPSYRPLYERTQLFPDYEAVGNYLEGVGGNVFFAIGSKNIHRFLHLPDFAARCYFRILAASNVLREVEDLGVAPSQIFAMKGVATKELNIALLHMVNAAYLVTKDSGLEGGMKEKEEAAQALGIGLLLIGRPADDAGMSFSEIWRRIDDGKEG